MAIEVYSTSVHVRHRRKTSQNLCTCRRPYHYALNIAGFNCGRIVLLLELFYAFLLHQQAHNIKLEGTLVSIGEVKHLSPWDL
jgi:hypothetical protein